jgi:hypothetical protein
MKRILSIAVMIMLALVPLAAAEDLIQAPAEIQIASTVSDGRYDIQDIVDVARHNGIKVVVMTDRDMMKWEYGAWPLRNVIKKTSENSSISTYGINRYLQHIEDVQRENSDIVIIAGLESAPYYHWEGYPMHNNLRIKDWHKHIITIGLSNADDIRNLPVAGNWRTMRQPYKLTNILYIVLPILLIMLGIFGINRRRIDYTDSFNRHYISRCPQCMVIGTCLVILGIAVLVNNYPYSDLKIDIYGKDAGTAPYQSFINYASNRGGLTFWSHPEAEYIGKVGRVSIDTRDHSNYILETDKYTGFAIFYEGYEKVGLPGGLWDEYLAQYCRGARKKPIWAIGGLSFEGSGELKSAMKDLRTVLLVPKLGRQEALDALGSGRMYVARAGLSSKFVLHNFAISDPVSGKTAVSGGELAASGRPVLKIKGSFISGEKQPCTIKIIRNGILIDNLEETSPFDISYEGRPGGTEPGLDYYRIEIISNALHVVSNPIFVRHPEGAPAR